MKKSSPTKSVIRKVLSYREHHNPGFFLPAFHDRVLLLECLHEVPHDPKEQPPEEARCLHCEALKEGTAEAHALGAGMVLVETLDPAAGKLHREYRKLSPAQRAVVAKGTALLQPPGSGQESWT